MPLSNAAPVRGRSQARGNAERTGRMVDMKKRIAAVCAALMLAVPVQAQAMADSEDEINQEVEALFPDTEIWAEPGRYICGTAVNLITSVIGTQERNKQQWYFLDDGLYGSFSGVIFDHWDFELESFKDGDKKPVTFAGPSCDSLDVLFRDKMSVDLNIGDLLLVPNCGAYTSASATVFNGFAKTPILSWKEVKQEII